MIKNVKSTVLWIYVIIDLIWWRTFCNVDTIIHLISGLIKKDSTDEWLFSKAKFFRSKYLSNYATKADLKNATGIDTLDFAKKTNLVI